MEVRPQGQKTGWLIVSTCQTLLKSTWRQWNCLPQKTGMRSTPVSARFHTLSVSSRPAKRCTYLLAGGIMCAVAPLVSASASGGNWHLYDPSHYTKWLPLKICIWKSFQYRLIAFSTLAAGFFWLGGGGAPFHRGFVGGRA